jgi:hypothetical protein
VCVCVLGQVEGACCKIQIFSTSTKNIIIREYTCDYRVTLLLGTIIIIIIIIIIRYIFLYHFLFFPYGLFEIYIYIYVFLLDSTVVGEHPLRSVWEMPVAVSCG